jgi:tRNA A22 N-methylase
LAFQGIRFIDHDFEKDSADIQEFVEKLLIKKCIHSTYAYVHAKKSVKTANIKNYYLSFTGFSFGAWLAERCSTLFLNTLKNKYTKNVTFKTNGSLDQSQKLFSLKKKLSQTNEIDLFKSWDLMDYLLAPYQSDSKIE